MKIKRRYSYLDANGIRHQPTVESCDVCSASIVDVSVAYIVIVSTITSGVHTAVPIHRSAYSDRFDDYKVFCRACYKDSGIAEEFFP
jgi:hypothetical protein